MIYVNDLQAIHQPRPILADYPDFVEPLPAEACFQAPAVVDEPAADLVVRAWRYWYNARGIVQMENRLQAQATALVMVHPWGLDDGHGPSTPEPAGVAFFCTREKNLLISRHLQVVVNPFLQRWRDRVALVAYSLPGVEDDIRKLIYPSIETSPEKLQIEEGELRLARRLRQHSFTGDHLVNELDLAPARPLSSYLQQTPATDAAERYNGHGYWQLPMPLHAALARGPRDLVFYDAQGYPKVRDYLQDRGVRHVLLLGYATDMCVRATTCGYDNLSRDFNVFIVGDATQATFPASTTPRFATQVALANAALQQMITQVSWIQAASN